MNTVIIPQDERKHILEINSRLKEKLMRYCLHTGTHCPTAITGLNVAMCTEPNHIGACFDEPTIGFVVQGKKEFLAEHGQLQYEALDAFVVGVDMPNVNRTILSSKEQPFLAVKLSMDKLLGAQLCAEMPKPNRHAATVHCGMAVAPASVALLEAVARLVDLLDKPEQAPVLAPMYIREIHYHTLAGPLGETMRAFCTLGSQSNQIAEAVTWLRNNFSSPVTIEDLARHAHMGVSTFHRHFKEVTRVSPLQFQKKLRLHEARRLMLTQGQDAGNASYAVGYESQTQFNREYKRLFGEPPHRDVSRLR